MHKMHEDNVFRSLRTKSNLVFDYEVSKTTIIDDETLRIFGRSMNNTFNEVRVDSFWDSLEIDVVELSEKKKKMYSANTLKRLVSKKKLRFQNEYFDLDLSYITKRVIAMGYPCTGCESIYRNSLNDVLAFMRMYHKEIKIYNLCLEMDRIYTKDRFRDYSLAVFPFTDHNPCPIKLMLEFCTDISLYMLKQPNGIAAVHCKAGKGRTGIMIICYLIFSGLCADSTSAIEYFAKRRTINNKGVTIPSQLRYIKYFETFLSTNFTKPYNLMIPQVIKYYINPKTTNIICNYLSDDTYFKSKNGFNLKSLKVGPFIKPIDLKLQFSSLSHKNLFKTGNEIKTVQESDGFYYTVEFHSESKIDFDLCVKSPKIKFYLWVNLWYSCLELISRYIVENKLFIKETKLNEYAKNLNHKNFVEMKNLFEDIKEQEEEEQEEADSINEYSMHRSYSEFVRSLEQPREIRTVSRSKVKSADRCLSVLQLINDLSNDPDLNTLISGINEKALKRNVKIFDKKDLSITITASDLDKFSQAKKMLPGFKLVLCYSLKY